MYIFTVIVIVFCIDRKPCEFFFLKTKRKKKQQEKNWKNNNIHISVISDCEVLGHIPIIFIESVEMILCCVFINFIKNTVNVLDNLWRSVKWTIDMNNFFILYAIF